MKCSIGNDVNSAESNDSDSEKIMVNDCEWMMAVGIESFSESESDNEELIDIHEISNTDKDVSLDDEDEASDITTEDINNISFNDNKQDFEYDVKSNIKHEANSDESDIHTDGMQGVTFNVNKCVSKDDISSNIQHITNLDEESHILLPAEGRNSSTSNVDKHNSKYMNSNFKHERNSDKKSNIDIKETNVINLNVNKHDSEYDISSNFKRKNEKSNIHTEINVMSLNVNKHNFEYDISNNFESEFTSDKKSDIHIEKTNIDYFEKKFYCDIISNSENKVTSYEDYLSDVENDKDKHDLSNSKDIPMTNLDKGKTKDYSKKRKSKPDKINRTQVTVDKERRKFKCCMCNKQFKLKHHLNQHILTHTNMRAKLSKTHKCQTCSKAFKLKHHLERHILTHKKEKHFNCTYCNKSYADDFALKKHINKKHSISTNLFKCNSCSETFSSNSELQKHIKTHNLACDICGKVFSARRYLIYHVRTHLKMTSFICDICGKAFPFNASLIEHSRSHSKDKPYACDVCNKAFSTKSNQVRHQKSHFKKRRCKHCCREFSEEEEFRTHSKACKVKHRCDKCNWEFKKLSNYKRHLAVIHSKYDSKSEALTNDVKAI